MDADTPPEEGKAETSVPSNLKRAGRRLWKDIADTYDLRVDEERILEDACREADLVDRLDAELRKSDMLVDGSMGQKVANPLIQEIRQHRACLQRLLGGLKLPDEEGGETAGDRSSAARKAANVRWARGA